MHTIGAFAVIFDDELRVLLCHRTDCDMWNLPGGRVEIGESPWQAVVREVQEETGLDVEVRRLLGVYAVPARGDLVLTFACVRQGGTLQLNPEADDLQWFRRDALPANTLPRHVERIADAFAGCVSTRLKVQ
ncbi:MAG TPA: NUDIX domain-containing protein [Nevskiaceae bacterium]|nr:NUDIX domain-containing protein [Nevskiaceae bacterium]